MSSNGAAINADSAATALNGYISKNLADDTSNLKNDKVYIYHGTADSTVTEGIISFQTKSLSLKMSLSFRCC
jgi:hypothetical protein